MTEQELWLQERLEESKEWVDSCVNRIENGITISSDKPKIVLISTTLAENSEFYKPLLYEYDIIHTHSHDDVISNVESIKDIQTFLNDRDYEWVIHNSKDIPEAWYKPEVEHYKDRFYNKRFFSGRSFKNKGRK